MQLGCPGPRPASVPAGGGAPGPLRAVLPRGQSEREGGRNARPVPRRRRAAVPELGPSLAAAFAISVSRNRKVPVHLAPLRSCLPPPAPLPLPLPAFGPCERSLVSPRGTGLGRWGQPGREGGLGSGDHPPRLSPLPGASGPAPRGQGCLDLSGVSWDPEVSDFSFFVLFWFFFPLLLVLPKRL